jgi:hypothetical protein
VSDTASQVGSEAPAPARPAAVWVISAVLGLADLAGLAWIAWVASGRAPLSPPELGFWMRVSRIDMAIMAAPFVVHFFGIALLFAMRAASFPVLCAAFAINATAVIYHDLPRMDYNRDLSELAGSLVWGAIAWYAYRLRRSGRLR